MDYFTTTADVVVNSVGVITTPFTNDLGAHAAPANALSADTIHSDDVNANAPNDASHLSLCSDASHLSACTVETLISTITENSMLNLESHQEPGMPYSGERADTSPQINSTKELAQFRIDCPAGRPTKSPTGQETSSRVTTRTIPTIPVHTCYQP
jgi:hypothetical protein